MTVCRTRIPWRFSGNLFIALVVATVMVLGELGFIPNQKIGFYCNDPKISFKFNGDSVSAVTLITVSTILPALVMWGTEWGCYNSDSYKSLESGSCSRSRQFWRWYADYTLGWLSTMFIVEIVKVMVGEPRPHFLDSCKPKELLNCTANEYRKWYTCTNTEISWIYVKDSDKSFPSGHSALSMFSATFLIWYLQRRMPDRLVLMLVKPWLQCLAALWGLGCSISRITDNRHHWWDVAVGGLLGAALAVFVVRVHCRGFRGVATRDRHDEEDCCCCCSSAGGGAGCQRGRHELDGAGVGGAVTGNGTLRNHHHHHQSYGDSGKRHQSVKKLLSNSSSVGADSTEGRELGDMPATWTA